MGFFGLERPAMLSYDLVDVFTEAPFAGNQLAVVHDAAHLSAAQCRALAREFNLAETTFPERIGRGDYSVRIFTPGGEVPFAGHPTLGTAWVLKVRGWLRGDQVVQHCGAGDIAVTFARSGGPVTLRATPRDLVGPLPDALVSAVLGDVGLAPEDLTGDAYAAGTGLTFLHLPVRPEAVARARPSAVPLAERLAEHPVSGAVDPIEGIDVYAVLDQGGDPGPDGLQIHARVFVPGLSVPEDAATGSSCAGLGLALHARGVLGNGTYTVTQGVEMGRPSRLFGRVHADGGTVSAVEVAGHVVAVGRGTVLVPEDP